MTFKTLGVASAALLLGAAAAYAAPAPAPAAASGAAQPALVSGPPIPGICVYHGEQAVAASLVGKTASTRLQQLRAQVTAELDGEQQSIQTDAQALQAKRTTITPEQFQAQAAPIQQRGEALQRKAQLRQRELEATSRKVLQRITTQVEPILRGLYQSHSCSLLLNGEAVLASNPAMDLTDQVVAQLNAQLSTITFDRETLPQQ